MALSPGLTGFEGFWDPVFVRTRGRGLVEEAAARDLRLLRGVFFYSPIDAPFPSLESLRPGIRTQTLPVHSEKTESTLMFE